MERKVHQSISKFNRDAVPQMFPEKPYLIVDVLRLISPVCEYMG